MTIPGGGGGGAQGCAIYTIYCIYYIIYTIFYTICYILHLLRLEDTVSWCGPVKTAEGRISPQSSTKVTESSTAKMGDRRSSRKMGKAFGALKTTSNGLKRP